MVAALLLAALLQTSPAAPSQSPAEVIAEVRVQGNQIATDAAVVDLAGVHVGSPFTDATLDEIAKKLRDSKQFEDVQVLKRFASIVDPSKIVVVIIVKEGPVKMVLPPASGGPIQIVKRSSLSRLMWFPIISGEDGYGVTFGVQLAIPDVTGKRGRVSFPLTWGGTRHAGAEFERTFVNGPITRLQVGSSIEQTKNPAFQLNDRRRGFWGLAERRKGPWRADVRAGFQHVSFDADEDDVRSVRGEVAFDTRVDPVYPRNAVYAVAAVERDTFGAAPSEPGIASGITRTHLEARGFVGLIGQTVIAMRVLRDDADSMLPRYLQSLLGGWSTLRGFQAGAFTGDTMVAGSVELRIPITSALSLGKIGVSLFVDSGKAYQKGQHFADATRHTGTGASVWLMAAFFQIGVGVSHGNGAGTRVNFGTGLSF